MVDKVNRSKKTLKTYFIWWQQLLSNTLYICSYNVLCIYEKLLSSTCVFPEFRCMHMYMYIERDAYIKFMSLSTIVYSHRYCVVVTKLLWLITLMTLQGTWKGNFLTYKEIKYDIWFNIAHRWLRNLPLSEHRPSYCLKDQKHSYCLVCRSNQIFWFIWHTINCVA